MPDRRWPKGHRAGWAPPPRGVAVVLALCLAGSVTDAAALETQFHGFAAQGFVLTDHYDYFGDSQDGELDYHEVGGSVAFQLLPNLTASAEVFLREAGTADDDDPRLNFALIDYRFHSSPTFNLGIRAGRVKNPHGFYNETRDVIFTRPSILLPESVYIETQGTSKLLFSADGGQLYGDWAVGDHLLSFASTVATDRELDRQEKRLLIELEGIPFDLKITRFWNAMLGDTFGKWRLGYTHTDIRFRMDTSDDIDIEGNFEVTLDVASLGWEGEQWAFTAEYMLAANKIKELRFGPDTLHSTNRSDGGYLQAQYRLNPQWTLLARYDANFADRSDRSGRDYASETGERRFAAYAHDFTVGANWKSERHWGIWGEVHFSDGTLNVPALENDDFSEHRWWTMLMLMAAYRF
jgi:hypothetical protein